METIMQIDEYKQKVLHLKKWIGNYRAGKMLQNANLAEEAKKIFNDDEEIRKHLLSLIPKMQAKRLPNFKFWHVVTAVKSYYIKKEKIDWLSHSHSINLFKNFNLIASHMKYFANQVCDELKCDYIFALNLFVDKILMMIKGFTKVNNYLLKY